MRLVVIMAAGLGTVSAIMVGLLLLSTIPTENYSLDVDPMKDEQSLFVNARVVLTNTGKMPLTNLRVDYGSTTESVSRLNPGQKVSLSPPAGSNLNTVVVSASEGINVTKDYRKPIKLPGMIGS
ncbi:MAG: hypothetical protein ACRD42_03555 [Nitrososphaeraceae archaeon]